VLVNYRVDPNIIQRLHPSPLRPQLVDGSAIAGVCLIRLEHVRPALFGSLPVGIQSEKAAHRIAVEWRDPDGEPRKGVYITRRDTGSALVSWAGGRIFPGCHHRARFDVHEDDSALELAMTSEDGTAVALRGCTTAELSPTSRFKSLGEASAFFESGSLGYSPGRDDRRIEGFCLETSGWKVEPFLIESVHASFFEDGTTFPAGSVEFDNALVMRNVDCRWRAAPDLRRPDARLTQTPTEK
jgi:Uncharacterized conserved protein (COG2071)